MHRRAVLIGLGVLVAGGGLAAAVYRPFPSDRTPEGAYLRIARSLSRGELVPIFPYLETDAQWACYTIRDARKKASELVQRSYPEPLRTEMTRAMHDEANAPDGSDVFALLAKQRGWETRLRKDMSGVARVDVEGERASVVTARGTRYPFRRRDNGIWGLTIFTADLLAEKERAARDLAVVEQSAADYDRAKTR